MLRYSQKTKINKRERKKATNFFRFLCITKIQSFEQYVTLNQSKVSHLQLTVFETFSRLLHFQHFLQNERVTFRHLISWGKSWVEMNLLKTNN